MILRTIPNLLYTIFYESQHKSSVAEGHGTDYYISADVDILIIVSACRPFYERNRARVDFKTCDGAWMNTGAGIGIAPVSFVVRKGGSVGVTGDEVGMVQLSPVSHALFYKLSLAVVSGSACRVLDSGKLQWFPDVPDKPAGQLP